MEDSKKKAELLIDRYLQGEASPAEANALDDAYVKAAPKKQVPLLLEDDVKDMNRIGRESLLQLITDIRAGQAKHVKLWPGIRIAAGIAAAVATIVFGVWFFAYREVASSLAPRNDDWAKNDVAPGRKGATITLANGKVIKLSGDKKGVVVANGKISYSSSTDAEQSSDEIASLPRNDEIQKLTAATAKGQTYEFTLPDGTHVWLNADSKISFPEQFSGKERKILLEGEAYFAVVHNAKQPFRVESKGSDGKGQVVEDLGTEFNIKAYADEAIVKTTLLSGRATVNNIKLSPNQQASNNGKRIKILEGANIEEAIDWKEGKIVFNDESLPEIMRKVTRWYNVEVVYEGDVSDLKYGGAVSRNKKISSVLNFFGRTGEVAIQIEGRKVTIKRK